MDLRKLKKLIDLVQESGIAELEITEGEEKVRIVRSGAGGEIVARRAAAARHRGADARRRRRGARAGGRARGRGAGARRKATSSSRRWSAPSIARRRRARSPSSKSATR